MAAAAWKRGDIGAAHVDALLRAKSAVTKEQLARDEEILVTAGITLKFAEFAHVVDYWEQRADPDGTDEAAEAKRVRRDAYLVPSACGYVGQMRFGTIDGAIVTKELKRIEQELFEADWAEAKERLGRDPHADELARTPAQRRADAMVEMAVRSASTPPGAKKPKPLFSVLVGFETLAERISEIENGPVVTPGSLLEWLDRAEFERIVFLPEQPDRVLQDRAVLHRGHQKSHRGARPPVPARVLRPAGRVVRHRPHQALERGRADRAGQCAGPVRPAQSRALRAAPAGGTT